MKWSVKIVARKNNFRKALCLCHKLYGKKLYGKKSETIQFNAEYEYASVMRAWSKVQRTKKSRKNYKEIVENLY